MGVLCTIGNSVCHETEFLQCIGCPLGSYYDALNGTHGRCRACPRNMTTLNETRFDVLHCECGVGYETKGEQCKPCPYGMYKSFPGNHSCTSCPANSTTLITEGVSVDDCLCEPGFFGIHATHECTPCPAGSYKSVVSDTVCDTCLVNKYCPRGSSSPIPCQNNSSSALGSSSVLNCTCDPGFESESSASCRSCTAGKYNELQDALCLSCPPNTFNIHETSDDSVACSHCPKNSSSLVGSSQLSNCLCDAGFRGNPGESCEACALGKFRSNMSEYICTSCPSNTYNDVVAAKDVEACLACPNSTESREGSGESIACVCSAGFHFDASNTSVSAYTCVECKAGFYQSEPNSSECIACAAGLYANATGATTANVCTQCAHGSYSLGSGSSACQLCGPSTYQNSSIPGVTAEECTECPAFSSHAYTGSVSRQDCICDAGYYAVEEDLDTYFCRECEEGFFCPGDGELHACAWNHYSVNGASQCVECAENSFGERIYHREGCLCLAGSEGSFDANCTRCLPGTVQPFNFSASACKACEVGSYQDEVGQIACRACPGNASTTGTGMQSVEACSCISGFYGPSTGPCNLCIKNSFCPGGSESDDCRLHSESLVGAHSEQDCTCVMGYYSEALGSPCRLCKRGFFCGGNMSIYPCAGNSSSVAGTGKIEGCMCDAGMWRDCIDTEYGPRDARNNTCAIDYTLPCHDCNVDTVCLNNTLQHCPANSAAPRGADKATDCVCDDGFFLHLL